MHEPSNDIPPPGPGDQRQPIAAHSPPSGVPLLERRLLLFDLDDTLCDYSTARSHRLRSAFGMAFAHANVPERRRPDLTDLIAASIAMHPHGVDHFPALLSDFGLDAAAAQAAQAWYRTNRFDGLELFPDAIVTLAALRRSTRGHRTFGVITNGPADVQRAKTDLLDILKLVDFVVISGEFGVEKPDPAIFIEALRLGNATANEAIYIGDSPEFDIAGAHAADIPAIWMNRDGNPWDHPIPPPYAQIRQLTDLLMLVGCDS